MPRGKKFTAEQIIGKLRETTFVDFQHPLAINHYGLRR